MRTGGLDLVGRLRGHKTAVGAVTGGVAALIAVIAALSTNGLPFLPKYELVTTLPAGAPTLRTGVEARIAGTSAGVITKVTATRDGRQRVRFKLRKHPVGANASITVRLKSPAGGRYLDIDRGSLQGRTLPNGAEIPSSRVRFTEDLPTVFEDFSRRALKQAQHSIGLAGNGVLGRGADLNAALDGAGKTVAGGAALLRAMAPNEDLPALTRSAADTTTAMQGRTPGAAARFVGRSADLFGVLGDQRTQLGSLLGELPPTESRLAAVLPQVDPLLADTTRLSGRLRPGIRALRSSLPAVNRLMASAPTLDREVPRLASSAQPALRALAPLVRKLGPSAILLARSMRPLGPLAGYLARYPTEITSGIGAYYAAWIYRPRAGKAPGAPIAPSLLVLTCAKPGEIDPPPGRYLDEHLDSTCR
jgi:phospholipid/cholesterol/gamma-HCH transport system substrate-binding protein